VPRIGSLKKRLHNGEVIVGPFVIIPSPPLVETLGHAGMDFCIVDAEHGPISLESATDLVIAAQGSGTAPIIRVGNNEERLILRALDIGAEGVQVPQINDADDARRVIHAAKYAPFGARGLSIFTRAGDYYANRGAGHTERQNADTLVVVHIEGQRGLDQLDEIMAVAGIDVLFLGPYDISQSLGVPGEVRSPKVEKALQEAAGKARAKGRAVGSYARDVEMGKWLKDLGVQYLAINVDATIYLQACESLARALK
jgi:4-hydroxy-2-oxoheptanedioate aldolase